MASDRGTAFEAALRELEEILAELERGEPDLDEALELFERGVKRLRAANRLLEDAEGRVEELIAEASGELRAVPFDVPREGAGEGEGNGGTP